MLVPRALLSFLVPGGVLLLTVAGFVHWGVLDEWFPAIDRAYPAAVFLAGILMGWRFHRSKVVFGILSLFLLDRALFFLGSADSATARGADATWAMVAFLVPLSLALIAMIGERGLFSMHGICRLCLVLMQWPLVFLVSHYPRLRIAALPQATPLPAAWFADAAIPQVAQLAFVVAAAIAFVAYLRRRSVIEAGLFWSLVAGALAIASRESLPAPTIYLSTGGLILVVSAIEVSFGLAFRDELTGLPARRAMNEALLRLGNRYAVAMADVDHFKKFNDRYGHDVGDQVLRMVASQLGKVGGGGRAYRYGGEEFAIIFPGRNRDEAKPHLERVRKSISSIEFVIRGVGRPRNRPDNPPEVGKRRKRARITVSFGVADSEKRQDDPLGVIRAADKALYRAKRGGRNRVAV